MEVNEMGYDSSKPNVKESKKKRDIKGLTDAASGWFGSLEAVEALGEIGDNAAVPALFDRLGECSTDAIPVVAKALLRIGDETVVPTLLDHLNSGDESMRYRAALALGVIGDQRAFQLLMTSLLKDKYEVVRSSAAEALGEFGDERAVPALAKALRDNEENVRWDAAKALGKIGEAAVPALIEALKDRKWEVRHDASQILVNRLIWDGEHWRGEYSPVNLAKIAGKAAVPTLIRVLRDEQWTVRVNAAKILGEIGDKDAIPALTKAMKDPDTGQAAKEALEKIRKG